MAIRQLKVKKTGNFTSSILTNYLNHVKKFDSLTPEEEVELTIKIKAGDRRAMDRLIEGNLRFVISVAKQYESSINTGGKCLSIEDLVQEGNLGLIKAAEKFDETKGFKFISYAVWWIRQTIQNYISENYNDISSIPPHINNIRSKVSSINQKFQQLEQRDATEDEIREILSDDGSKQSAQLFESYQRVIYPYKSFSLQDKITTDGEETFSEIISSPSSASFSVNLESTEKLKKLLEDIYLNNDCGSRKSSRKTKEVALKVFFDTYGLNDVGVPISLNDIAEKLGITRERCRQLLSQITLSLQALSKSGKLNPDMLGFSID